MAEGGSSQDPPAPPSEVESTAVLLDKVRHGDESARNRLISRYLPILVRWASGRLPSFARDLLDTNDVVQSTLIKTLNRLEDFKPTREGALLAYLRTAIVHQVYDEMRKARRRPGRLDMDHAGPLSDEDISPLEQTVGNETVELYEKGLASLSEVDREAVILRLEMGMPYAEVAEAVGKSSPNAARMAICRALTQLAEVMHERRDR